jgi:homoserine kinase type II
MDIDESIVHVLQHYDVGRVRQCRPIPSGYVNDHWWVETTSGQYFLKRRRASLSQPREVAAQHALIQFLRTARFPAPTIALTRHATTFVEQQSQVYELHHYIAGELCDAARPTHWAVAVSTLASYHRLADGFDHPLLHWPRERYGPTALAEIIDRLLQAWQAHVQRELEAWMARVKEHADDLATRFSAFGQLPQLVIHGDYYAENLIFQGDRLVGVVDFDLAHWSFRAMELAEALIYFATARPARLKHIVYSGVLDLEAVERFLRTYSQGSRPSELEIRALPHLIRTIWLCASLAPPLRPPLSVDAAPHALPEILTLADWSLAHAEDIIEMGLAARA